MKIKPEVQKEIISRQEKIMKLLSKQMQGKDRNDLIAFLQSGKAPGSKEFSKLKPNVQKGVAKLNLAGLEIMINRTKNPISKFRYMLAKVSVEKLMKSGTKEKKKKK